jgi:hypothetical protein
MLNPNVNHLNNFLNPNVNYLDKFRAPDNYITINIRSTFYTVFETPRYYPTGHDIHNYREKVHTKIMDYAINSVKKFITLIEEAPEKIDVNEKSIAGIRKDCTDVLGLDDAAKLHEVLKDLDNVVFLQPAGYMRAATPFPVGYKYLAFTYPKEFIKNWLKEPQRIQYCDTDERNSSELAIPYILCPLSFNCNPAYVKLSQILHIIHSTQRIFYVLPSPSEGPHKCMKQQESQEILQIAICNSNKEGNNCWKFDENTKCITASEQEKVKIQTECNMNEYKEYMKRKKILEKLKRKRLIDVQENSESIESLRNRERKYKKIII